MGLKYKSNVAISVITIPFIIDTIVLVIPNRIYSMMINSSSILEFVVILGSVLLLPQVLIPVGIISVIIGIKFLGENKSTITGKIFAIYNISVGAILTLLAIYYIMVYKF